MTLADAHLPDLRVGCLRRRTKEVVPVSKLKIPAKRVAVPQIFDMVDKYLSLP